MKDPVNVPGMFHFPCHSAGGAGAKLCGKCKSARETAPGAQSRPGRDQSITVKTRKASYATVFCVRAVDVAKQNRLPRPESVSIYQPGCKYWEAKK